MAELFSWDKKMLVVLVAMLLMVLPVLAKAQTAQEDLQIMVRRYMQCQADNVGTYNIQVQLSQGKLEKVQAELDAAKKEIEQLKDTKKDKS